jgi:hypothetical protein
VKFSNGRLVPERGDAKEGRLAKAWNALADNGLIDAADLEPLADLANVNADDLRGLAAGLSARCSEIKPDEATVEDIEVLSDASEAVKAVSAALHARVSSETDRRKAAERLAADIVAAGSALPQTGRDGRRRLPSISELARSRPAAVAPRRTATDGGRQVLTAAGEPSSEPVVAIVADGIRRELRSAASWDGSKATLATVRVLDQFPDERRLDQDEQRNQAKLETATGPEALAASGGVCGPVAADYDVSSIAAPDRPLRDTGALAHFAAARGGIRYILPHTFAQVTGDGPASIWTETNDVNPTSPTTKPHSTFVCQAVQEAYVDAVTTIVQFGNFQARYFPEQIQQYLDTVQAVTARLAESTLLAAMTSASTAVTAGNYEVGGARELLKDLDRAVAGVRYRHRMNPDAPLRFVYPEWLEDMIRADLALTMPGDSGGASDRLAIADAEIGAWFATRNVNPTKTLDSPAGATGSAFQGFGVQNPGNLNPWPSVVQTWLYPEATWTFLDGGELNLGMVRDSILNRTNDFQMFSETFEKAIFRGHESLQITFKVAALGTSIGTVAGATGGTEVIGS